MGRIINDHAVAWKYGHKVLYPSQIGLVSTAASRGAGGQLAAADGDTQITDLTMDSGDEVFWLFSIDDWADADLSKDIQCRITWYCDTAADTGFVWKAFMKGMAAGAALSDAAASSDGAITFASQDSDGADLLMRTEWAGLGVAGELSSDAIVTFGVELDDAGTAAGADETHLVCVSLRYTRQFLDSSEQYQLT